MKLEQVAIQLYTLRDFTKTTEDYARTLRRVREIGYKAIQISAVGPIPVPELRIIAENEGLAICATHEPAVKILGETDSVIERIHALGCKHTAYPNPAGVNLEDADQLEALFVDLEKAAQRFKEAGLTLSYHNHSNEFCHYKGRPILEWIYEKAPTLAGEPDTYWVQAGGGDPVDWCRRLKGRLPLLHLKDYGVKPPRDPYYAEIGYGNLNFKAIIAEAEASGCEWFIVEQDTCPGDPFESVTKSFNYIKDHLVEG